MLDEEKNFLISQFRQDLTAVEFTLRVGDFLKNQAIKHKNTTDEKYWRHFARMLWDVAACKPNATVLAGEPDRCAKGLQPGEPSFTLTGHDVITPATIAFWAREAIRLNVPLRKVHDAIGKALLCERWQNENWSKVPD